MTIIKKFVLLLKAQKSEDTDDSYEVILQERDYIVKQVKTLDFNYVNLEILKKKLSSPDNYSGVIFSSPRCIRAVKLALGNENLADGWRLKDNYAVGEATYKAALGELKLNCLGRDTGNANNLSEVILEEKGKYTKCFLYPHGNLKMDILKTKFANSNVCLEEVMVYETISNKNILNEVKQVTNQFSDLPEYIVFFSPSGIKAMENVLPILPLQSIKMIAIGPTTESAMLTSNLNVYGTAERPTAQHLLQILLKDV